MQKQSHSLLEQERNKKDDMSLKKMGCDRIPRNKERYKLYKYNKQKYVSSTNWTCKIRDQIHTRTHYIFVLYFSSQ